MEWCLMMGENNSKDNWMKEKETKIKKEKNTWHINKYENDEGNSG